MLQVDSKLLKDFPLTLKRKLVEFVWANYLTNYHITLNQVLLGWAVTKLDMLVEFCNITSIAELALNKCAAAVYSWQKEDDPLNKLDEYKFNNLICTFRTIGTLFILGCILSDVKFTQIKSWEVNILFQISYLTQTVYTLQSVNTFFAFK